MNGVKLPMVAGVRNSANMLVYAATEEEFQKPAVSVVCLKDIVQRGFEGIYLEYRNVRMSRTCDRFRVGLARLVKQARSLGLYVVLDASLNHFDADLRNEHPEAFTEAWIPRRCVLNKGKAILEFKGPSHTWKVEKIWYRADPSKAWAILDNTSWEESRLAQGGGCAMTRNSGLAGLSVRLSFSRYAQGELFVLCRRSWTLEYKDMGHPEVLKLVPRTIDWFGQFNPDGFFWDEPHFGFAFANQDGRAINARMLDSYTAKHGSRLEDCAIALWEGQGAHQVRTRLRYSELLESSLRTLEQSFHRSAIRWQQQQGENGAELILGAHRTMHEELSDDVLIGCADYFQHNQTTSDAFTDAVFERPDSVLAMAQLARGMASSSPGQRAWNMSWGFLPTQEGQHAMVCLLGALGVRWDSHAYHGTLLCGPGFPHHPCWLTMGETLAAHRRLLELTEGADYWTHSLLVYNWRAAAAWPNAYRHMHRRELLQLSYRAATAGRPLRWISSQQLNEKMVFHSQGGGDRSAFVLTAKRLVLPWPDLLPLQAWDVMEDFASDGGEIVFFGPPANWSDCGQNVRERFEQLIGASIGACIQQEEEDEICLKKGKLKLNPVSRVEGYLDSRQDTFPHRYLAWELQPKESAAIAWKPQRGTCLGSRAGRVSYLSFSAALAGGDDWLLEEWEADGLKLPGGYVGFPFKDKEGNLLLSWVRLNDALDGDHSSLLTWKGASRHLSPHSQAGVVRLTNSGQLKSIYDADAINHSLNS